MNTNHPSDTPQSAFNDQVNTAVRAHRGKIRLLTGVAFLFGFLAIITSIALVWSYMIVYLPKDKQVMRDAGIAAIQRDSVSAAERASRSDQFLGAQIAFTHVISVAVTILSIAVGVLALGTLILAAVVTLNRRVTLNQINTSLAQISDQLRDLRSSRAPGPPSAAAGG